MGRLRVHQTWSLENFDDGYVDANGRFRVWFPNHPRAESGGYVYRTIVAFEAYHGKEVTREMCVHHIDEDTLNDSKENLEIMSRRGSESHASHHNSGERNPMFGMTGKKCPAWRRTGENSPRWKGDAAKPFSKYERALEAKRRAIADGRLTPEIEAEYERAKIEARPYNTKRVREWKARKRSQS